MPLVKAVGGNATGADLPMLALISAGDTSEQYAFRSASGVAVTLMVADAAGGDPLGFAADRSVRSSVLDRR